MNVLYYTDTADMNMINEYWIPYLFGNFMIRNFYCIHTHTHYKYIYIVFHYYECINT